MSSLDGKMAPFIEILIAAELLEKKNNWKYNLAPPFKYLKILHHILILLKP